MLPQAGKYYTQTNQTTHTPNDIADKLKLLKRVVFVVAQLKCHSFIPLGWVTHCWQRHEVSTRPQKEKKTRVPENIWAEFLIDQFFHRQCLLFRVVGECKQNKGSMINSIMFSKMSNSFHCSLTNSAPELFSSSKKPEVSSASISPCVGVSVLLDSLSFGSIFRLESLVGLILSSILCLETLHAQPSINDPYQE